MAKKAKKTKKTKETKRIKRKTKYQRGDLGKAIFELFDDLGIANVTYEQAFQTAKNTKPDTTYERGYFAWHKNKYKNDNNL